MIILDNIKIKISGFRLLPINESVDMTTAEISYLKLPDKFNGGIIVKPIFTYIMLNSGILYITQVCTKHILKIIVDNCEHVFNTNGVIYKDTHFPTENHYDSFVIQNYQIFDSMGCLPEEAIFADVPFIELLENWNEIFYFIEFETCFQYSKDIDSEINPILSFKWFLNGNAKKTLNKWELILESHSDESYIQNSIKRYSANEQFYNTTELQQINKAVSEYRKLKSF